MNRLSNYFQCSKLARMELATAKDARKNNDAWKAINHTIAAVENVLTAMNNVASIGFRQKIKRAPRPAKLIAAVLFCAVTAYADGPQLSANLYAPESTSNPYGTYGSAYSPYGAANPYGQGVPLTVKQAAPHVVPVINVWADAPAPRSYDFSGFSRLQFQNGHPVINDERPAASTEVTPAVEPHQNIIDALDEIRKGQK